MKISITEIKIALKKDHKSLCYAVMRGCVYAGVDHNIGLDLLAKTIADFSHAAFIRGQQNVGVIPEIVE